MSPSLGAAIGRVFVMVRIGSYHGKHIRKENDMALLNWALQRLKEPSTYAGFSALALAFGLSDAQWAAISTAVAGLAGVAAVFLSDTPKA